MFRALRKMAPMAIGTGTAIGLSVYVNDRVWGFGPNPRAPYDHYAGGSAKSADYPSGPGSDWTGAPDWMAGPVPNEEVLPRYEKTKPITHFEVGVEIKDSFSPDEYRRFPMQWSRDLNHDTKYCRFVLPTLRHSTGMDLASCIVVRCKDSDGKVVERPYTPISQSYQYGFFDLVVKKYPTGKMGNHIHSLAPGDSLDVKGPFQKLKIGFNEFDTIGMVAGGSGITPMYQVITGLLKDPRSKTSIRLVYANNTPQDILLVKELARLATKHSHKFQMYNVVLEADGTWKGGLGYVNPDILKTYMPKPGQGKVLVCGPPGMVEAVSGKGGGQKQGPLEGMLKQLGYSENDVFKF
eukprot:TRINITY_DN2652_c1_g1_i1.p1 TRINITY_DN2652_c1_g1~~TRINITY_DN2652_c1_g1_i1.p1  ORF type:complete len:351 (+),score=102.00 TRINITY_DN2652_c1_g1_i1:106-1158(+)